MELCTKAIGASGAMCEVDSGPNVCLFNQSSVRNTFRGPGGPDSSKSSSQAKKPI